MSALPGYFRHQLVPLLRGNQGRKAQREELERQNAARAAALKARQEAARVAAINGLSQLPEATPDHPYLITKGMTSSCPLRLRSDGWLVVPIYNAATGQLQTLQSISPIGRKQFLKDGVSKGGCVMPGSTGLDDLNLNNDPVIIA
jgi:putative DNA primase/helicase